MALHEKQLEVKDSTLPKAGKGLFTRKLIPKGTRIVEYKGKLTTWKQVQVGDKGANPYIYYVKRDHVIDAAPHKKAMARYANDARGLKRVKGVTNNAIYVEDGLKVYIEAKKDIPAGAEILVDYGKEYWEVIRYNKKLEEKRALKAKAS
ncbi:MAG: SET domain-containing protein [Chitinophagaceae bacterium]|nr:SET domain-containing protein [Chitinophagaceae bacterium]